MDPAKVEAIQKINEGKLYTYLQIKEDAHTLYGFFEKEERMHCKLNESEKNSL